MTAKKKTAEKWILLQGLNQDMARALDPPGDYFTDEMFSERDWVGAIFAKRVPSGRRYTHICDSGYLELLQEASRLDVIDGLDIPEEVVAKSIPGWPACLPIYYPDLRW